VLSPYSITEPERFIFFNHISNQDQAYQPHFGALVLKKEIRGKTICIFSENNTAAQTQKMIPHK
jgi:hypothetical protein